MENLIPRQNFARSEPVTVTKPPSGAWKQITFDIITVLAAGALGFVYRGYLADAIPFWGLLLAFVASLSASLIATLITHSFARRFLTLFLEVLALLAPFYAHPVAAVSVAGLAGILFFVWGALSAQRVFRNSVSIHFFSLGHAYLAKCVTGVLLMAVLLYYPVLGSASANQFFISQDNFKVFFDWSAGLLKQFYPNLTISESFVKTIESYVQLQLSKNPQYLGLPVPAQVDAVNENVGRVLRNVSDQFEIQITDQESASDVFYQIIVKYLNNMRERYGALFIVGWVIGLFLIVRTFGAVFISLVAAAAFVVYELLLSGGFLRITTVSAHREVIEY